MSTITFELGPYADADAREAQSGLTDANIGNLAWQEDTGGVWAVTAVTDGSATWAQQGIANLTFDQGAATTGPTDPNTYTFCLIAATPTLWAAFAGGGSGTVTSVALTVPSWLSVSGSPITSSGTLAVVTATGQTANLFLATPNGETGAVTLRAIVAADLPNLPASIITSGQLALARGGTGSDLSGTGGTGEYVKQTTSGGDLSVGAIGAADLPLATTSAFGAVKPDGSTITISDGVISSTGGGGGVNLVTSLPSATSGNRGQMYLLEGYIPGGANYASTVEATSGATDFWQLQETSGSTAADSIGSVPLTIHGGVTLAQPGAFGDSYTSYEFNGSSGYLSTSTVLGSSPTGAFSFDGWFNIANTSPVEVLISTNDSGASSGWVLYTQSNELHFQSTSGSPAYCQGGSLSGNTWYHIGFSYNDGAFAIYVNGSQVATGSGAFATPTGTSTWFGRYQQNNADWFAGYMQQLAFYDSALTSGEFLAHYDAGMVGVSDTLYISSLQSGAYTMQQINLP